MPLRAAMPAPYYFFDPDYLAEAEVILVLR